MNRTAWRVAVVGAGPVGLALALHGARLMPDSSFTVYDAREAERDISGDPRTLALAEGSVMFLRRLGCWDAARAAPIHSVHVSQMPPSPGQPQVLIEAAALGAKQLGAVLSYGALVAPLQRAWLDAVAAEPARLSMRFGTPVASVESAGGEATVQLPPSRVQGGAVDGQTHRHDLAVVAEGGVFAEQARKSLSHDYRQTAWVGTLEIEGGAVRGRAYERFTRQGPAALLPLPDAVDTPGDLGAAGATAARASAATSPGRRRAALVWCVNADDDPVRELDAAQRLALLGTLFPDEVGRIVQMSPLKDFALGLNAERTLVEGRVVRIGNAAQTLHPVAGQGLNLGLRDAHELVAALRHADNLERALRSVEWSRAPDRWAMIAATDFLARSFTWKGPGLAALRAAGLAAVQHLPAVKEALARRMMFGGR
ncbi:MAG: FAD-dependent monooxygenase [Burkholderiales bacterium]|nr:FAD-dependent monooxygenase [Burkholderiales bacterium]